MVQWRARSELGKFLDNTTTTTVASTAYARVLTFGCLFGLLQRGGFLLSALELYLKNDMKAKCVFLNDLEAAVGFTSTMMTQQCKHVMYCLLRII